MTTEINTELECGLQCRARITHLSIGTAYMRGHPDSWEPPEDDEFEFEIIPRLCSRPSRRLDRLATDRDWDRIGSELIRAHERGGRK